MRAHNRVVTARSSLVVQFKAFCSCISVVTAARFVRSTHSRHQNPHIAHTTHTQTTRERLQHGPRFQAAPAGRRLASQYSQQQTMTSRVAVEPTVLITTTSRTRSRRRHRQQGTLACCSAAALLLLHFAQPASGGRGWSGRPSPVVPAAEEQPASRQQRRQQAEGRGGPPAPPPARASTATLGFWKRQKAGPKESATSVWTLPPSSSDAPAPASSSIWQDWFPLTFAKVRRNGDGGERESWLDWMFLFTPCSSSHSNYVHGPHTWL